MVPTKDPMENGTSRAALASRWPLACFGAPRRSGSCPNRRPLPPRGGAPHLLVGSPEGPRGRTVASASGDGRPAICVLPVPGCCSHVCRPRPSPYHRRHRPARPVRREPGATGALTVGMTASHLVPGNAASPAAGPATAPPAITPAQHPVLSAAATTRPHRHLRAGC